MTSAQKAAFDQIGEIMREHFEAGAYCVLSDLEGENHGKEEVKAAWNGGRIQSVGLFLYGADQARGLIELEEE